MSKSLAAKVALFAAVCALLLVGASTVEADNGWRWKKPLNQRLGAFYTTNKAFKKSHSTHSRYRSHSRYYRHWATSRNPIATPRAVEIVPAQPQWAPLPTPPVHRQAPPR